MVDAAGHGVCQIRKMPLMSFGISDCLTVDGIEYVVVHSFLIKIVSLLSIHIIFSTANETSVSHCCGVINLTIILGIHEEYHPVAPAQNYVLIKLSTK